MQQIGSTPVRRVAVMHLSLFASFQKCQKKQFTQIATDYPSIYTNTRIICMDGLNNCTPSSVLVAAFYSSFSGCTVGGLDQSYTMWLHRLYDRMCWNHSACVALMWQGHNDQYHRGNTLISGCFHRLRSYDVRSLKRRMHLHHHLYIQLERVYR